MVLNAVDRTSMSSSQLTPEIVQATIAILTGEREVEMAGGDIDHVVEGTVDEVRADSHAVSVEPFDVVSAPDMPAWYFDHLAQAFERRPQSSDRLLADQSAKLAMFAARYQLVAQRIARHEVFAKPILATDSLRRDFHTLTPIDGLQGVGPETVVTIMGFLSCPAEQVVHIEDANASVPVDLTKAGRTVGIFAEGCIVVARGSLSSEGVFVVEDLAFPPAEERTATLDGAVTIDSTADAVDWSGLPVPRHQAAEFSASASALDGSIIVASDVCLGEERVMQHLGELLDGFDSPLGGDDDDDDGYGAVPVAFVLCGNFCVENDPNATHRLRDDLGRLARMIRTHRRIARESTFVLVPGPADPLGAAIAPMPILPFADYLTELFRDALPNTPVHFASNPCRLRYFDRDFVVYRDDVVGRMRRHAILSPVTEDAVHITEEGVEETVQQELPMSEHVVKTILDQAHLSPLTMLARPVYWRYDHALQLHPLPHCVILADRYPPFEHSYVQCKVVNPGSFAADASFIELRAGSATAEFCRVEPDDGEEEEDDDVLDGAFDEVEEEEPTVIKQMETQKDGPRRSRRGRSTTGPLLSDDSSFEEDEISDVDDAPTPAPASPQSAEEVDSLDEVEDIEEFSDEEETAFPEGMQLD
jgi:DNA polymerase epsilon subunit 2